MRNTQEFREIAFPKSLEFLFSFDLFSNIYQINSGPSDNSETNS